MQPVVIEQPVWAIGLMSGTSLDGMDVALIRTDGSVVAEYGPSLTIPFSDDFQERLQMAIHQSEDLLQVEKALTQCAAGAVATLLKEANMQPEDITVVGFHGQTIDHRPDEGLTWQLGNGALLASLTQIDVVCDFRRKDMAEGGQGAPLVPLYHAAITQDLIKPLAVLNIGGVANVTWIDESTHNPWILGFDTGPGNGLMDQWMQHHGKEHYDKGGEFAASGTPDETAIRGYFYDIFFATPPPKSLDRYAFGLEPVMHLEPADAMATLCAFTSRSIIKAVDFMPYAPKQWLVCGGGRHNSTLMAQLADALPNVTAIDDLGIDGEAIEAQAMAYLAVRRLINKPITLPQLTGVHRPLTGGAFYPA